MTTRKPPNVTWPGWVERQIRTAEADGAFENLPGAGKPIAGLDAKHDDLTWVADYLRREKIDVVAVLPPALALAKEVEDLPERLVGERSEFAARQVVEQLNDRIVAAHAAPQIGPPFRVKMIDVDAAVEQWRVARAELLRLRAEARARDVSPAPEPDPLRRRRFGRRR